MLRASNNVAMWGAISAACARAFQVPRSRWCLYLNESDERTRNRGMPGFENQLPARVVEYHAVASQKIGPEAAVVPLRA